MFTVLAVIAAGFVAWKLIPSGISKFDAEKSGQTFVSLGGDVIRHTVGAAEILGPILLFLPFTAVYGLVLVTPVMLGAIYLHMKVWGNSPRAAVEVLASTVAAVVLWAL